mgnify:CR=1 FL=1
MKKKLKIALLLSAVLGGTILLSSCTANFCTPKDQSKMLFAYENGVVGYYDGYAAKQNEAECVEAGDWCFTAEGKIHVLNDAINRVFVDYTGYVLDGFDNVYYTVCYENSSNFVEAIKKGTDSKIKVPDLENKDGQLDFFKTLDTFVLVDALTRADIKGRTYEDILSALHQYGYLKFYDEKSKDNAQIWENFDYYWDLTAKYIISTKGSIDYVPSNDFKNQYKTTISALNNANRSCLTTVQGNYGLYGPNKEHVELEAKTYNDGWSKGFFEGLLVWPLGAFIDTLATGFGYQVGTGVGASSYGSPNNGVPQLLAILVITVIIRLALSLLTIKQTMGNAKMTELQPEITKIQAKYPNANTNRYEKQRMAEEMQKLYKKNKINPFSTILVLIVQFPVFICVWGALSGSAILTNGTFLGLRLGESISSALFNGTNWTAAGNYGAVTALFLFILMGVAQTIAMLLPQWMQKAKAKKVAKLGKNPSQKSQDNKMKWVTYIMLIMIIIMGFSLVSAMGVYWLVGALFSIAQTLITQKIIESKNNKKQRSK